jgi:hypothetical protein
MNLDRGVRAALVDEDSLNQDGNFLGANEGAKDRKEIDSVKC